MGMYTEIYVNIDLDDETPEEVIKSIQCAVNCEPNSGDPARWQFMGHGASYTPNTWCAVLNDCEFIGKSLLLKGSIKNYGSEIEQFFDMIRPWSRTEFMGYMRYEEDEKPTLVFKSQ